MPIASKKVFPNWTSNHDLLALSKALGKYLTAYYEFTSQDGEVAPVKGSCSKCQGEHSLFVPSKKAKQEFRDSLKTALVGAPSNISPLFNHFWFHARCSNCGEDLVLMRS